LCVCRHALPARRTPVDCAAGRRRHPCVPAIPARIHFRGVAALVRGLHSQALFRDSVASFLTMNSDPLDGTIV
jgi:hypothetical protein